jgi:hypothetical protein
MRTLRSALPFTLVVLGALGAGAPARGKPTDPVEAGRGALGQVCEALDRGDDRAIRRHARIPLRARIIVSENAGNPVTKTITLKTPQSIRDARLCRGLEKDKARVTATRRGWRIVADVGQFDALLELVRTRQGPQLEAYRQPAK